MNHAIYSMPWKLLCCITICICQVYEALKSSFRNENAVVSFQSCAWLTSVEHKRRYFEKCCSFIFFLHIVKVSVWTTTFFKISAFMFHKIENIIQVWNDMRVHDNGVSIFGRTESEAIPKKKTSVYSALRKYSYPFIFFSTFCYVAALC